MTIRRGDQFLIEVLSGTSPDVWTAVEDLFAADDQSTRQTTKRSVFNRATPHTTRPPREKTLSIQGIFNPEDPGQSVIRAAMIATPEETVFLRITHDGTNGYSQEFQVNDRGNSADPDDNQSISWTAEPVGDATAVGAGPINP